MRTVVFVLLIGLLMAPLSNPRADDQSVFDRIRLEHEDIEKTLCGFCNFAPVHKTGILASGQPISLQSIDVRHYRLQITLDPAGAIVSGRVTVIAEATSAVSSIDLDVADNLTIDSASSDGSQLQFSQRNGKVTVNLPGPLESGKQVNFSVEYHGKAAVIGRLGSGMLIQSHENRLVMANLSEPFGAPTWWPCIDDPRDKATIDIEATVPPGYLVASNGLLTNTVENAGQSITYFWQERNPLATYLVSVAATNYERFDDSYTALDGITQMPLVYYVYPEHLTLARQKFAVTRRAMEIFAGLFGEYPFLNEKYGMAEFPWNGAMEHQTMTSMGERTVGSPTNTGQLTIAHELAHQWWGDLVTMRTWEDIWLNEGFATYSEVLFVEHFLGLDPGEVMSRSYDDGEIFGALGGTVTAENRDDPFDDRGGIYTKGGWVLHMLRHLVGDEKFFRALKDYRARHEFGNGSTGELREAFERQYGQSLDWFFQQWVYAPGRPLYKVSSELTGPDGSGAHTVKVTLKQKQSIAIPGRAQSVFITPLDLTVHFDDGTTETRVVMNDSRKQKVSFTVSKRPTSVGVDEGHWVLKKVKGQ